MVLEDLKPRQILTPGAFRNAVASVLAGQRLDQLRSSICRPPRSRLACDMSTCSSCSNELGDKVPVLLAVRPNGEDRIEDFEAAGGARAMLKQLAPLLDTQALTVTGQVAGGEPRATVRWPMRR